MTALQYQEWVVAYIFDLDGITACESFVCVASGGLQAIAVTGVQLGLCIARFAYESATLAEIASPDPIGPASFRIREIRPYCLVTLEDK